MGGLAQPSALSFSKRFALEYHLRARACEGASFQD